MKGVGLAAALACVLAASLVGSASASPWRAIEIFSRATSARPSEADTPRGCLDPSTCPETYAMTFKTKSQKLPSGFAVAAADPPLVATDEAGDPYVDDIVRIGKEIWDVVEKNKGVINYNTDYSGAVPMEAVDKPFLMSGWVNQDFKGWRWQLVNGYNSTVVDFTWAFKANSKGQLHGEGQFLNHVTTVIGDIYAAWGFEVNINALASEPYNAGSQSSPVAVQELQVTMEVKTALNSRIENCHVRFFGDGRSPQCVECATFC